MPRRQGIQQGSGDAGRNLVLDCKHVFEFLVERLGPEVITIRGIHQLGGHAYAVLRLADAAFEDCADAELPADPAHIPAARVELERRGPGRHLELVNHRQCIENLFGDTLAEVALLLLGADVDERQHGD